MTDDIESLLFADTPKPRSLIESSLLDTAAMLQERRDNNYAKYQDDPVGYARDVLRIELWSVQCQILKALYEPPYRVLVKSGNGPGKSFSASTAINHHYDCFDPSLTITTAPTKRDVEDVLWKTVRIQRQKAGLADTFIGPTAPEMRTNPDHYAKGYTARRGESFKGRHDQRMLFVFDEAIGVDRSFWTATETMFHPDGGHSWLVLFNPTDPTSMAYQQEHEIDAQGNPKWNVFTLSCLDHPNVVQKREVIPGAVTYAKVCAAITEYCDPIHRDDHVATDVEWEGRWYRPSPEFESNILGRWPSQGSFAVWTDALWESAAAPVDPGTPYNVPLDIFPEIGGDLAGAGKDMFELHSRWGPWSLKHESYNGWMMPRKLGRIMQLCEELADLCNKVRQSANKGCPLVSPKMIRIKLDDANAGGDMVAVLKQVGYNVVGIHPQRTEGVNLTKYPNMRSHLWFSTAKQAGMGFVKYGRLPKNTLAMLKNQAMAPAWWQDHAGRRCVEDKEITMEKCGRSPDGMDAINLCFLQLGDNTPQWVTVPWAERLPLQQAREHEMMRDRIRSRGRRPLFGRR